MVKRYGNLYSQIVTYENLYTAYRKQPPPQDARNGFRGYEAGAGGNLCSRDFQIARLKAEFWGGSVPTALGRLHTGRSPQEYRARQIAASAGAKFLRSSKVKRMVKRYGNLYSQIVTFKNLYTAYRKQPPPQNARNGFRGYEAGAGGNLCSRDFQIARLKAKFWGGVCPRYA